MHSKKIKNRKNAFSLIELIVVTSILIIIASSGTVYFTGFVDDLAFNKMTIKIGDEFKDLDKKIDKKEIFDYELYLSAGTSYYTSSENIFDLEQSIFIDTVQDGIGKIKIKNGTSSTGSIKIYKGIKFIKQNYSKSNKTFTGSFEIPDNYRIEGTFSGKTLNTVNFNYFDDEKLIHLVKIDTNISKNLNSIVVKNILGKKTFGNDSDNINKIILTFENNLGKVKTLELNR